MDDKTQIDPEEYRFWRKTFDKRLEALDEKLDNSFGEMKKAIDHLHEAAVRGFPDDDPYGHRRVHENQIKKAETREKIKDDVVGNTVKGIVWVVLAFIGTAIWQYVKDQAQK